MTPDVTHLVVGDYDTQKYRHVAKERPDIRVVAAGWVDAVLSLWTKDADISFGALEDEWRLRPLETCGGVKLTDRGALLCCLTGFEDGMSCSLTPPPTGVRRAGDGRAPTADLIAPLPADERQEIIDKIHANGGFYTGDLTRKVTHLIVSKPEGRKYQAAKSWGLHTVSVEWLHDSVARGLILDETKYDPLLPKEERGVGAWNRKEVKPTNLGKRARETDQPPEEGARKLRKTASMKLSSQRENLWGDILGKQPADQPREQQEQQAQEPDGEPSLSRATSFSRNANPSAALTTPASISSRPMATEGREAETFAACLFYVHGFTTARTDVLVNTVVSLGGQVTAIPGDLASQDGGSPYKSRIAIVPQEAPPKSHPAIPDGAHIVTEFYIEKCMHKKQYFDPGEHVIGRPFPVFPIQGFERLSVCTGGFTGVDLNQVDKTIRQLGARYEERFTAQCSLLLVPSLEVVRKQKLDLAVMWKVPVVDARWLWECISTGFRVPVQSFLFAKLGQDPSPDLDKAAASLRQPRNEAVLTASKSRASSERTTSASSTAATAAAAAVAAPKTTGAPKVGREESNAATNTLAFETAPTHQPGSKELNRPSAALSELSANELNKASSPHKAQRQPRKGLSRVVSEVADSEAAGDSDLTQDMGGADDNDDDCSEHQDRVTREKAAALAAADRRTFSTRLSTLLGTAAGSNAAGLDILALREDNVAAVARPRGRRRGIMGRAVSNVSAGSSGSAELTGAKAAPVSFSADPLLQDADAAAEAPPPATQLGYEDPLAKKYKAELMKKMMGGAAAAGKNAVIADIREERLTLMDIQAGVEAERRLGLSDAGTGGSGRRHTRRK